MQLDEQQPGGLRRIPGEPGRKRQEALRVPEQGQAAGEERFREGAVFGVAESLPEPSGGTPVPEQPEPRLRLQHPEHRLVEPGGGEPAGADGADQRLVGDHRILRHQDQVHPGGERRGGHLPVEAAGARPLHVEGVADHQAGKAHPGAEHPAEDLRGEDGRAVVPPVQCGNRQVTGHDRRDPGFHGGPERGEVHRFEVFAGGGDGGEPVVAVGPGAAMSGEVLRGRQRASRLDAAQEGGAEPGHQLRVRPVGARADDRALRAPQHIEHRGEHQVDADRARLAGHDAALALQRLGVGSGSGLHRRGGSGCRRRSASPFPTRSRPRSGAAAAPRSGAPRSSRGCRPGSRRTPPRPRSAPTRRERGAPAARDRLRGGTPPAPAAPAPGRPSLRGRAPRAPPARPRPAPTGRAPAAGRGTGGRRRRRRGAFAGPGAATFGNASASIRAFGTGRSGSCWCP